MGKEWLGADCGLLIYLQLVRGHLKYHRGGEGLEADCGIFIYLQLVRAAVVPQGRTRG